MNKQDERIAILKDTLKHLKANRIKMTLGNVMAFPERLPIGCELQDSLKEFAKKNKPCGVCQRGGLLFSMVWKNNDFKISENEQSSISGIASELTKSNAYLETLFSMNQLAMMETAFEKTYNKGRLGEPTFLKCVAFMPKLMKRSDALFVAIIKNAIKNKGIFKP